MTSPINALVDAACGLQPSQVEATHQARKQAMENEAQALVEAAEALVAWWAEKRPAGWTVDEHLMQPAINRNSSPQEKALAEAAAALVLRGW